MAERAAGQPFEEAARSAVESAEQRLRLRLAEPLARAREALATGRQAPQTPTTATLVAALDALVAAIEAATAEGGP